MYTIWAAKTRGTKVFAFEPESQSCSILNRNILRNGLVELPSAYCVSLADTVGFGRLALIAFMAVSSVHQFADSLKAGRRAAAFLQSSYGSTLDTLVADASITVPIDPGFRCDGAKHHGFELFRQVMTPPYSPNSLFGFFKTDQAFHGMERIDRPRIQRDLMLYNIHGSNVAKRAAAPRATAERET
ncbi:MAG: hypothetical protein IT531_09600 [Burkholderiales bacterium]|nr:hypothetical protein [Burkholderiales bacterium]